MAQELLLVFVTLAASLVGTASGFGTSTIMIPVLSLSMPLPAALLFVGVIHLCGDVWKVILFRRGLIWRLVLGFGLSGIIASYFGATFSLYAAAMPLKKALGVFLILYVVFLFVKRDWALPKTHGTAVCGGLLSGFFAGFFGVGGAVRGAFLAAYDLPKDVYVFTSGVIALFIDLTRVYRYVSGGTRIEGDLLHALLLCIPVSFIGAWLAKRFLQKLPQRSFRFLVGLFLALVGLVLLAKP